MRASRLLLPILAIAGPPAHAAAAPDWMTGYWLSCDGVQTAEAWIDGAPGGMLVGVNLNGKPPKQSFEFMRIATVDDRLAFIASPSDAPPTVFPLKSLEAQRAVFENPAHDFPQRVIYERRADTLSARIEGDINGETQSADWTFHLADLGADCPAG